MNFSPKQNSIITLSVQIIGIRIDWQIFLTLSVISKIPAQITHTAICNVCRTQCVNMNMKSAQCDPNC